MTRLAVVVTHPIQYHAPLHRELAASVDLEVLFAHDAGPTDQAEAGFGDGFAWDTPLLAGYRSRFLQNRSRRPSVVRFGGCDTPEIGAVLDAGRFDALLVHGWHSKSYWQAVLAARRRRIPVLVRGDSQLRGPGEPWKGLIKWPVYRPLLTLGDAFLVPGRRAAEYLRYFGVTARRIFSSPHAVDNAFFAERSALAREHRSELRLRWGIPVDSVLFVFAGKLVAKKRPGEFVRAVAAASRAGAPVAGLVVGSGPLEPGLRALSAQLEAPAAFAGFLNQSRIPEAYAASDVLVLPSDGRETWGLVVNEAMAAGLPAIVATDVGCVPDLIRPGTTGWVHEGGGWRHLGERLLEAVSSRSRLREMGRAAQEHVLERYSLARAAGGVLEALSWLRGGAVRNGGAGAA